MLLSWTLVSSPSPGPCSFDDCSKALVHFTVCGAGLNPRCAASLWCTPSTANHQPCWWNDWPDWTCLPEPASMRGHYADACDGQVPGWQCRRDHNRPGCISKGAAKASCRSSPRCRSPHKLCHARLAQHGCAHLLKEGRLWEVSVCAYFSFSAAARCPATAKWHTVHTLGIGQCAYTTARVYLLRLNSQGTEGTAAGALCGTGLQGTSYMCLLLAGLGGGSHVAWDHGQPGSMCTVGPQSVGQHLTSEALCFGGQTTTATDVAVALGRMPLPGSHLPSGGRNAALCQSLN